MGVNINILNRLNNSLIGTPGQWLQLDLRSPTRITAVVTQGLHNSANSQEWVTSYKISYGNSTDSLQFIQDRNGTDLVINFRCVGV